MAGALEQFVNNVRTLSTQGNYGEVREVIAKAGEVLLKHAQHLDNVLETLDIQQHTLGVLGVLTVKLTLMENLTPEQHENVLGQVHDFLTNCNQEQIQLFPDFFTDLCHLYTQALITAKTPLRGIEFLIRAITKLQISPAQLTSAHADLCQLCLLAKNFKPALPFLNTDVTSVCQEGAQFDTKYFLLYYYYGGMIYTALKQYEEALYFFEVAVTTPARAVSHIMLEAYKKYILVSLIHEGKSPNLPKFTSQVVNRFIKPLSSAYLHLAAAYAANSTDEARAVIQKNESIFVRDQNLGLAKQVLASLTRNNIQRLTKTFLTLSLSDVAARVQLQSIEEAERHILNMIEDGEIFATVNKKDGMVVFHDDPEKYNSPEMLKKLEDEVTTCIELDRKIQEMEEEIILNPAFVKKCTSQDDDSQSKSCPYSM